MTEIVLETNFAGLPRITRGKVRDIYAVGDEFLLIVTTDRISAFDCVLPNGIPYKGKVLTALSAFWFDFFADRVRHHLVTTDVSAMPPVVQEYASILEGRTMLVHKAEVYPVECVARGYLVGSGWKDYQQTGAVCGHQLPPGLPLCAELPEVLFTPATKAVEGHDENIDFARMQEIVGSTIAEELRRRTLEIYSRARDYARDRGIIIADTKFEWGHRKGEILLVDEVLTPDSSRFWPAERYKPGQNQPSYDKQIVRDYLETLSWNKRPPAPELPEAIVQQTSEKYLEIYTRLTGRSLL